MRTWLGLLRSVIFGSVGIIIRGLITLPGTLHPLFLLLAGRFLGTTFFEAGLLDVPEEILIIIGTFNLFRCSPCLHLLLVALPC